MLVIRREQMDTFGRVMDAKVADEVVRFLREERPGAVAGLPEPLLRRRVARGLERARGLGLKSDEVRLAYVGMMIEFGPRFDRHPAVAATLDDQSRTPDDRMRAVVLEVPDRVWSELAILADPDAWDDEDPSGGPAR